MIPSGRPRRLRLSWGAVFNLEPPKLTILVRSIALDQQVCVNLTLNSRCFAVVDLTMLVIVFISLARWNYKLDIAMSSCSITFLGRRFVSSCLSRKTRIGSTGTHRTARPYHFTLLESCKWSCTPGSSCRNKFFPLQALLRENGNAFLTARVGTQNVNLIAHLFIYRSSFDLGSQQRFPVGSWKGVCKPSDVQGNYLSPCKAVSGLYYLQATPQLSLRPTEICNQWRWRLWAIRSQCCHAPWRFPLACWCRSFWISWGLRLGEATRTVCQYESRCVQNHVWTKRLTWLNCGWLGKPLFVTCLLYLNAEWPMDWAAETLFLDDATDCGNYAFVRPQHTHHAWICVLCVHMQAYLYVPSHTVVFSWFKPSFLSSNLNIWLLIIYLGDAHSAPALSSFTFSSVSSLQLCLETIVCPAPRQSHLYHRAGARASICAQPWFRFYLGVGNFARATGARKRNESIFSSIWGSLIAGPPDYLTSFFWLP